MDGAIDFLLGPLRGLKFDKKVLAELHGSGAVGVLTTAPERCLFFCCLFIFLFPPLPCHHAAAGRLVDANSGAATTAAHTVGNSGPATGDAAGGGELGDCYLEEWTLELWCW